MAEFSFNQLMRSGHVKRWQIVRVAREQTIAEHMYRVWLITCMICAAVKVPPDYLARACRWALVHDLPEVITGDIATPTKKAMREHLKVDDPMRRIELSLSDNYAGAWAESKEKLDGWPPPYDVVKLADMIEAHCFLACEGMGNHATEVRDGIRAGITRAVDELVSTYPAAFNTPEFIDLINESWSKV